MLEVLRHSWALLLGMLLLMLGNGLQGSLLGVRGSGAGFSAFEMSLVMSAYFAGFLLASRLTPGLIRRVGGSLLILRRFTVPDMSLPMLSCDMNGDVVLGEVRILA